MRTPAITGASAELRGSCGQDDPRGRSRLHAATDGTRAQGSCAAIAAVWAPHGAHAGDGGGGRGDPDGVRRHRAGARVRIRAPHHRAAPSSPPAPQQAHVAPPHCARLATAGVPDAPTRVFACRRRRERGARGPAASCSMLCAVCLHKRSGALRAKSPRFDRRTVNYGKPPAS